MIREEQINDETDESILEEFVKKITEDATEVPSEIQNIIEEHFWELL